MACNHKAKRLPNKFSNVDVDQIVKGIAKENVFMGSAVGIAGSRPDQWERFEALETKVDEKALVVLTDHSNAVVRCYAFQGLVNKNSKDVFNLLVKHLTDTAQIQTLFGCVGHTEKVGDFFLGLVISGSENYQLNRAQRALIDSILFYDNRASLAAQSDLLDTLKPESRRYGRIKEMAIAEHNYPAVVALSKFGSRNDKPVILGLLRDPRSEVRVYGLRSVINFPDPNFFPELTRMVEKGEKASTRENKILLSYLYKAVVQYKSLASRSLLENSLHQSKGMDSINKTDLVYQALKEFPDKIYVGVIKYDFYK